MKDHPPGKIAYLVSCYPAYSLTFILREIDLLRKKGLSILTASINSPNIPLKEMPKKELAEYHSTFYIKQKGVRKLIPALIQTVIRRPRKLLKGILSTLKLGVTDFRNLLYSPLYLVEAIILGEWMRKEEISHLHVHFGNPAATVAMLTSEIYDIPFSLTIHGPTVFDHIKTWHLEEKIERAAFIACIGLFARSQLMKWSKPQYWDKLKVTPLGVETEKFSPKTKKIPSKKVGEEFNLLSVGRLVPEKGQLILVDALKILVEKRNCKIHTTIVGDGPSRKDLEKKIKALHLQDQIDLTGALNQNEVRELYNQADLFVLPSFSEGIPIVLMEAMAMEIPSISTFVNGIPELIDHGVNGILVKPSDAKGLSEAIENLILDPKRMKQIGKEARSKVIEKYRLDQNSKELLKEFNTIIKYFKK